MPPAQWTTTVGSLTGHPAAFLVVNKPGMNNMDKGSMNNMEKGSMNNSTSGMSKNDPKKEMSKDGSPSAGSKEMKK